jgi:hypothetical protein
MESIEPQRIINRNQAGTKATEEILLLARRRRAAPLPHFLVVVLAVCDVPLLRAFQDDPALVGDLLPRHRVDLRLLGQQHLQRRARLLPDRVAILEESNLVESPLKTYQPKFSKDSPD